MCSDGSPRRLATSSVLIRVPGFAYSLIPSSRLCSGWRPSHSTRPWLTLRSPAAVRPRPSTSPARRLYCEHMFGRRWGADATYRRSQTETGLRVRPGPVARGIALRLVSVGDEARERRRLAQMLVDELDTAAGLPGCEVAVADRAQVHEHDG